MPPVIPELTLSNGNKIPILGLGTWNSPPGQVSGAVKYAIKNGYRHLDCAYVYGNESEVGDGVASVIAEGVVKREDLFITSKLWNTFHKKELVRNALLETLKNLQMEYIDLYLIHWPMAYQEGGELFPTNADGSVAFSDADFVETWKAMEECVLAGLVKSIGLSNFNKRQLDRILAKCQIQPVMNQVECHPYLTQQKLSDYCKSKNILITAYSPLGSPNRPWAKPDDVVLLKDPKLEKIATKFNKTPAQILIRYQIERGHIVIPKSIHNERINENADVFDFQLEDSDIDLINSFDCNGRLIPMTGASGHSDHPFENDTY